MIKLKPDPFHFTLDRACREWEKEKMQNVQSVQSVQFALQNPYAYSLNGIC